MHRYSKFLIVAFVGVVLFGVYSYFYNDLKSADASSSLVSSLTGGSTTNTLASSDKIDQDISFINQLNSLTGLKIDTTLFSSRTFNALVDNNIKLDQVPYGRDNPFSPIGNKIVSSSNGNGTSFTIITKPVTSLTNSSVVLNGSLEGTTSDNVYFQYGTTQSLGINTSKVKLLLIGDFSINLTNLKSNTTYYYRSVASVNGSLVYGDITSFKTK